MLARIWRLLIWLFAPKIEMPFEGYSGLFRDEELQAQWDSIKNRHIWGTCHYIDFEEHPPAHEPMIIYIGKFQTMESLMDQLLETYDFGYARWYDEDISSTIWERRWVKLRIAKQFFTR